MPTYEIHFRDQRAPEAVRADEMRHERGSIVFRSVLGDPDAKLGRAAVRRHL